MTDSEPAAPAPPGDAAFSPPRPDEGPLLSETQEAQAVAAAQALRCLECNGESVYDSRSRLARSMRAVIRKKLASGETPEAVVGFFRASYGDRILMKPPVQASTLPLWGAPFLVGAGAFAWVILRRKRTAGGTKPSSGDDFSGPRP